MSPARPAEQAKEAELIEEWLGTVRIDGARHSLVWIHNAGRTVSIAVDRPEQGSERVVRLIGAFGPTEGFDVIEPLIADFEEHYVKRSRRERIRPRPLEPEDLVALPGSEWCDRHREETRCLKGSS